MVDLVIMEQELRKLIRERDEWKMKGYDTPQLTYHEQLEMLEIRLERFANKIRKELGE